MIELLDIRLRGYDGRDGRPIFRINPELLSLHFEVGGVGFFSLIVEEPFEGEVVFVDEVDGALVHVHIVFRGHVGSTPRIRRCI